MAKNYAPGIISDFAAHNCVRVATVHIIRTKTRREIGVGDAECLAGTENSETPPP
jgi:hypothetical protein